MKEINITFVWRQNFNRWTIPIVRFLLFLILSLIFRLYIFSQYPPPLLSPARALKTFNIFKFFFSLPFRFIFTIKPSGTKRENEKMLKFLNWKIFTKTLSPEIDWMFFAVFTLDSTKNMWLWNVGTQYCIFMLSISGPRVVLFVSGCSRVNEIIGLTVHCN